MINELKKHGLIFYLYAEDLALTTIVNREMKRAIISIEQWSKENSMKLNRNQCGILRLNKKSNKAYMKQELQGISYVSKFNYLGIWLKVILYGKDHLSFLKQKLLKKYKVAAIL